MLAIKSDTRYRLKQKESNTQRFERNLLKQSKKASHVLLTPLPFQFYFPPQFFLFHITETRPLINVDRENANERKS